MAMRLSAIVLDMAACMVGERSERSGQFWLVGLDIALQFIGGTQALVTAHGPQTLPSKVYAEWNGEQPKPLRRAQHLGGGVLSQSVPKPFPMLSPICSLQTSPLVYLTDPPGLTD